MPTTDKGGKCNLPNTIQCIYWNVRSISGKKNIKQLQEYITKRQVDLLFLSETWQRKGKSLPDIQGYGLISCMSNPTGGRGGVACYFKNDLESYISCFKKDSDGHYLWLKIDHTIGFEKDVFAAICYYPPISSTVYKVCNRLEEGFPYGNLSKDIRSFSMQGVDDFFVVGDFNSRIGDAQAPEAYRHGLSRDSADKKTNQFGLPLLDVCNANDLIICNGVTQVWPKSGKTTCRSKSVVDYIIAHVYRARYLVKDIEILPLETKSDHNAMNFTLRRSKKPFQTKRLNLPPLKDDNNDVFHTLIQENAMPQPFLSLDETSKRSSLRNGSMNDQIDNNNLGARSGETKTNHEGNNVIKKVGMQPPMLNKDNFDQIFSYNPTKTILASNSEMAIPKKKKQIESTEQNIQELNTQGLFPNSLQTRLHKIKNSQNVFPIVELQKESSKIKEHQLELDEQTISKKESNNTQRVENQCGMGQKIHNSNAKSMQFEANFGPNFDPIAWVEQKTTRLIHKIIANGLSPNQDLKKSHYPIVVSHKKGYMTKSINGSSHMVQTMKVSPTNKILLENNQSSKFLNPIEDEIAVHDHVMLHLKKKDLMTINSRPTFVAPPGLVHVARLYGRADILCRGTSHEGSKLSTKSWGPNGFKTGLGFRCTCMHPGGREFQLDGPIKANNTVAMIVVEPSSFTNLIHKLKNAYDYGRLWKSITQFKIAQKLVKVL